MGTSLVPVPTGFDELCRGCAVLASYHAVGSEADPSLLSRSAETAGLTICFPYIVNHHEPLRFLIDDGRAPQTGPFGLRQPPADAPPALPDIVLVPLLGFDRALQRIGQGAGHYDRALAALPRALRVGVALSAQEVPAIPVDPWDQPLDAIVTEAGLIRNSGARA